LAGKVASIWEVANGKGHYSFAVQREIEISTLLVKDEELVLPNDLDYFTYYLTIVKETDV
jgi:hypothetical protein